MTQRRPKGAFSLRVRSDQPLIGIVRQETDREVVHYFTDEEVAGELFPQEATQAALGAIGAWSDLIGNTWSSSSTVSGTVL